MVGGCGGASPSLGLVLVVALLGVLGVELALMVGVDMAVAGVGRRVDGALALLEPAGRHLGGVCKGGFRDRQRLSLSLSLSSGSKPDGERKGRRETHPTRR